MGRSWPGGHNLDIDGASTVMLKKMHLKKSLSPSRNHDYVTRDNPRISSRAGTFFFQWRRGSFSWETSEHKWTTPSGENATRPEGKAETLDRRWGADWIQVIGSHSSDIYAGMWISIFFWRLLFCSTSQNPRLHDHPSRCDGFYNCTRVLHNIVILLAVSMFQWLSSFFVFFQPPFTVCLSLIWCRIQT